MFTYPGDYFPAVPLFDPEGDATDRQFLSLPEETQQLLLKKGSDSPEEMAKQIEMLKMKE